jgi:lipopolysaccharide export system protein LptA
MAWAATSLVLGLGTTGEIAGGELPEPAKPAGPIHISADRLISDSRQNNAEFSGHVKVVQDQTTIVSDRLKILYKGENSDKVENSGQAGINAGSIDAIEAYGNVRIEFDNRVAVGQKAVYTTNDRKLVLTGPDARVTHGSDMIEGSTITYYRDNGKVEIVGQVKATIRSDQRGLN